MAEPSDNPYWEDFLAEHGMLKCALCGHVGNEADYRLVALDEPRSLDWVCFNCLESIQNKA